MTSEIAPDRGYQRFVWRLPPADPQLWLAAAVALHRLFDAVFTGKTWLCRDPDGDPATFAPIELARLAGAPISLATCRELIAAANGGDREGLGQGGHVIVHGETVNAAIVEHWHPRTALVVEVAPPRGIATVTYMQQRGASCDPSFPGLLERALLGLGRLTQGGDDTADVEQAVRSTLPDQSAAPRSKATAEDLFIRRFSAIAAASPDHSAVISGDERISYGELARATDRIVHGWRLLALAKGDRLLVIAPRGPALVKTMIAAFKAGLAVCVIDPRQPDAYVTTCRRIVGPALVINLTGRDLALADVPVLTTIDPAPHAEAPPIREDRFEGDDCAIVTLTSGTTREPKAVMGRYSSLTRFFDWMDDHLGPMAGAAFGMCSSIGHDPLQRDIMTPLYLGGYIVIPDECDLNEPRRLSRWLANRRIEFVCLNAALVPWLASSTRLPQLRALFCVGGALTRSQGAMLCQVAPNARVVNLYGTTETQRAVGFFELPRDPDALAALPDVVPLGRGMRDVDLVVRDLSRPGLALPFQIGEIALRSPYIALGYAGDPELSARKFRSDALPGSPAIPTYLTGDLGYVSLHHGVVFTGRMDDQHKISGYRVELTAIDDMCRQHPGVGNAATLVVEVEGLPTLATCVVPGEATTRDGLGDLHHWLSQRLPHYMVPHHLCVLSEIPLTLNRKIDTRALTELVRSRVGLEDANVAGVAAVADALAATLIGQIAAFIHRHTGQKDPVRDVALAELGIDSLRFVALLTQLSRDSGGGERTLQGLHNGMSIVEIEAALTDQALPGSMRTAPVSSPSPSRAIQPPRSPRDLLGAAIEVTETRISFASRALDHCCSNSYLGLAGRPEIRAQIARFVEQGQALGAHGSAELNGFTVWHERLTAAISEIHGSETALLYGSGYLANVSAIAAAASSDSHLFVDESCHQSLIDGCRLSGARISVYRHNDVGDLEGLLSGTPRSRQTRRAIVTEGVFSIEGDVLELPAIHALARRFDCRLIVDEACSLGQLGIDGSGVEAHFGLPGSIDIRTGTLAKALGSTGGYATCRADDLIRLRFQRGASFSTSLSPLNAFIALQGARLLREEGRMLTARLDRNAALWREGLNAQGFDTGRSSTAIVPIMCADPEAVTVLFERALDLGVYAMPISSPWSRRVNALRTSVTSAHDPDRLREIVARFTVKNGLQDPGRIRVA